MLESILGSMLGSECGIYLGYILVPILGLMSDVRIHGGIEFGTHVEDTGRDTVRDPRWGIHDVYL